jgi:cation:H+ antiporter
LRALISMLESTGPWAPWAFVGLFLLASLLMVWRLEAMIRNGLGGTVIGTLVMPYCSGFGNLVFALLLARENGNGAEVVVNCLVNNVTNLTLLIGVPTMLFGMNIAGKEGGEGKPKGDKKGKADKKGKGDQQKQVNRLSLLLTLVAVLFFTGIAWALARDGRLDFNDGLVLVGAFLFWQCFHVYEVLKTNVQQNKTLKWLMIFDVALLLVGAWGIYTSTDWLMNWGKAQNYPFLKEENGMGWVSGFLMAAPNALLAIYYSWRGKPDVTYASQVGDGHICIPLCIGLFALFHPIQLPKSFELGVQILIGATCLHLIFLALFGRLPRFVGWVLTAGYAFFIYKGVVG